MFVSWIYLAVVKSVLASSFAEPWPSQLQMEIFPIPSDHQLALQFHSRVKCTTVADKAGLTAGILFPDGISTSSVFMFAVWLSLVYNHTEILILRLGLQITPMAQLWWKRKRGFSGNQVSNTNYIALIPKQVSLRNHVFWSSFAIVKVIWYPEEPRDNNLFYL